MMVALSLGRHYTHTHTRSEIVHAQARMHLMAARTRDQRRARDNHACSLASTASSARPTVGSEKPLAPRRSCTAPRRSGTHSLRHRQKTETMRARASRAYRLHQTAQVINLDRGRLRLIVIHAVAILRHALRPHTLEQHMHKVHAPEGSETGIESARERSTRVQPRQHCDAASAHRLRRSESGRGLPAVSCDASERRTLCSRLVASCWQRFAF